MKKHILIIVLFIAIIVVTLITYFTVKDTKSYPTKEIRDNCNVQTDQFMGRSIFSIRPKDGTKNEKVILYFHGGSYIAEMTKQHWDFVEKIVNESGSMVILPDYPLVPKYNYTDVFDMVVPLYKEIINRIDTKNLVVMGDSAGGGLGLALEEKLGEEGISMPSQTILISPWLDVSLSNERIDEVQKYDKDLNKETLKLAGIAYAKEDVKNYLVSPLYGDLSRLENIVIYTGTYDILNPDVYVLRENAKNVGVNIEIKEYEQAPHIWIIKRNCEESLVDEAYQDLLKTLRRENGDVNE